MHDQPRTQASACADPQTAPPAPAPAPRRDADEKPTVLETLTRDRAALVRYAWSVTGCREDAEDAVQAAALIALRRTDVRGPKAIGWLLTVIRHEAYRRHATARRAAGRDIDPRPARGDVSHPLAAPERDVDGLLDLRAAFAACTPDERRALAGRMTGHSYREIAARQDWTYTKVNRCVTEGRARVRALMAS